METASSSPEGMVVCLVSKAIESSKKARTLAAYWVCFFSFLLEWKGDVVITGDERIDALACLQVANVARLVQLTFLYMLYLQNIRSWAFFSHINLANTWSREYEPSSVMLEKMHMAADALPSEQANTCICLIKMIIISIVKAHKLLLVERFRFANPFRDHGTSDATSTSSIISKTEERRDSMRISHEIAHHLARTLGDIECVLHRSIAAVLKIPRTLFRQIDYEYTRGFVIVCDASAMSSLPDYAQTDKDKRQIIMDKPDRVSYLMTRKLVESVMCCELS